MKSLGMGKKLLNLDSGTITDEITKKSPGNYAIGYVSEDGFVVRYVGRSDSDISDRVKDYIQKRNSKFNKFKFSYAASSKEAYEKECRNYHDFNPPLNDIHPRKPDGTKYKCPVCGE